MKTPTLTCCICNEEFQGYGNDPSPIPVKDKEDRCCDDCNYTEVIPARLRQIFGSERLEHN